MQTPMRGKHALGLRLSRSQNRHYKRHLNIRYALCDRKLLLLLHYVETSIHAFDSRDLQGFFGFRNFFIQSRGLSISFNSSCQDWLSRNIPLVEIFETKPLALDVFPVFQRSPNGKRTSPRWPFDSSSGFTPPANVNRFTREVSLKTTVLFDRRGLSV